MIKKTIFITTLAILLTAGTLAMAADKVVVIPLNSKAQQAIPDQYITFDLLSVGAGFTANVYSPPCPAGYRLSGGGHVWSENDVNHTAGSRPVMGFSALLASGANSADRYLCQGTNEDSSNQEFVCFSVCIRIPGS